MPRSHDAVATQCDGRYRSPSEGCVARTDLPDRRQQWLAGLRPRRMAYPKARGEAAQALAETAHWGGYPGTDCRVHSHGKPGARPVTGASAVGPSRPGNRSLHRGWHVRPSAGLHCCDRPFPRSSGDYPAPQGCGVAPHGDDRPDTTRPAPFGNRERWSVSVETDVRVLHTESCRAYLFQMQTNVRRWATGEAGCVPGAGSLARVRVAQLDAGARSSAVLSGQLKAGFKGPLLLSVVLCNKVRSIYSNL